MNKLYIIGTGPGNFDLLTTRAQNILKQSKIILSTTRISQAFAEKTANIMTYKLNELMEQLQKPKEDITCVLVSGDCGFFSISKQIVERFSSIYNIELISGVSSIQYFAAKLGIPYDDAQIVSMHGRYSNIVSKVCYNKKVFTLTGGSFKAHNICQILSDSGLGEATVYVGENLSYESEAITCGTAEKLKNNSFGELTVMYIENSNAQAHGIPLSDSEFIRGSVPMTKEEVRCICLQKLKINSTDVIYDIGAGTGSVAIEMARKAYDGTVYAIEEKTDACDLIEQNRKRHGAYNVNIINTKAPAELAEVPPPQKAFIGGSGGKLDEIIQWLTNKNDNIKIVATAITLQSIGQITDSFARYGFNDVETICVNVAKSKKVGCYDMMMAQNPIYIVTASKGGTQ